DLVATVENDFGWPETLPKGWKKVDDATATFLVELIDESCIEVALGEPGVTQANCIDGGLEAPSVTLPTTVGVVYSLDGDIVSGGTAAVTATLLNDYGWPAALPEGWEKVDAATATYPINFQDIQCTPAVPVAPVTTDGTCLAGVYPAPTVTPAETEGITYTVDFDRETGEYTVTATLADSYAWGEMPDGWDEVDATTATIAGAVALNPCVDVIPVDPTTTEGTCLDGAYTAPTVTPAETEGISYQVDLDRETGEYTVIATLADGYAWG